MYNVYQQMAYKIKKDYSLPKSKNKSTKMYDLVYVPNGNVLKSNAPYPVCNAKKIELIQQGYSANQLTIKPRQ
jgi:hypothetical protein